MNKTLHTRWGTTKIGDKGYFYISSGKEGYNGNKLHRLLFESFYGKIPDGFVVHHKNGVKTDNCILNLQLMRKKDHDNKRNTSGFYRVSKCRDEGYKLGFRWRYIRWENGVPSKVTSASLPKLKNKVLEKGWEWHILDEDKAKLLCDTYGYDIMELT